MNSPRRSPRRHRSTMERHPLSHWQNLNHRWRRQYIDFGHCRISKCTDRLHNASAADKEELKARGLSFVAMAITAGATASGTMRSSRERDVIDYINKASDLDLNLNDDINGESSVELASYHGMHDVLILLLDLGCPLKKERCRSNAVVAAVRNGQHTALDIILSKRKADARKVIQDAVPEYFDTGYYFSPLMLAIKKCDTTCVQLLISYGLAMMSDYDFARTRKNIDTVLRDSYASISNVSHWCGKLHWSFPTTDRETLNWLWHTGILPCEIWRRVYSYISRGWFLPQHGSNSSINPPLRSEVLQRNIIIS